MALTQTNFAGRNDDGPLSVWESSYPQDSAWTQPPGRPFRVRFGVSGTGTIGGTLEFSTDGSTFIAASDTSGTVKAARSNNYDDGDTTSALLTSETAFATGYADEDDAVTTSFDLSAAHTELEYCVQLIADDVSAGGTILLRSAGLDTYNRTASLVVASADLDRVRAKIGDTDNTDYMLTDAEIQTHIADWPDNLDLAAANAAEAIAAKYARDFTFQADGQTFNRRERVLHYMDLSKSLRRGGHLIWPN